MASHHLIDSYLAGLAQRLPAGTVDELADGLIETWQHHLASGLAPPDAARAAIAEFGTVQRVADEFVVQSRGRRTARLLLATGPVMAACWGASLIGAGAWHWPIPAPVAVIYAVTLLGVVAALVAAATSRHSYWRTRLGDAGALVLIVVDAAMVVAVVSVAPVLVWPMALAIPASVARIGLVLRSRPMLATRGAR